MKNIIEINTDEDFEEKVLNSNEPCVLDFYTDWCPPCKMLAPKIENVAKEMKYINFYKINAELASNSAAMFNVMSVPLLVSFYKKSIKEVPGLIAEEKIKELALLALDAANKN